MSRSGYHDEVFDEWALVRWRGAVASAIRGHRGQLFLRELLFALDELEDRGLIAGDLINEDGAVCAIGSVGKRRGLDMSKLDPENAAGMADAFGIAEALVREIEFINDEAGPWHHESQHERWRRVREWVAEQIKP